MGDGFSIKGTNFDQIWKIAQQNLRANGNSSPTTADIIKEMLRLGKAPQKPNSPIAGFHLEHNDSVPTMKYGANIPQGSIPTMKYGVHLPSVPQLSTKYAANIGCVPTPFVPSSGVTMKYAVNIGCNPQVRQTKGHRIKLSPEVKKSLSKAINQIKMKNIAAHIKAQYKPEG